MPSIVSHIIIAAPSINSHGIVEWAVRNIIPIVLLVIGSGSSPALARGR